MAIANDVFCYKLQKIKDGIVSKPEVSFDATKIQKPNVNKKAEHIVIKFANDSASGKKHQIPVNCSRKRLFEDMSYDNREIQSINLCNNNNISSKKFYPSQRIKNDDETIEIIRNITRLNLTDSLEIQNETLQTSSNMAVNKFHLQNSNEKKVLVQNEMRLADKQIENRGHYHSEFEKQDTLFKINGAMKVNKPVIREFKSINGYTIEFHLKKFIIRSKFIEERILSRIDEWICCFKQTMEDILAEVLKNYDVSTIPSQWTLQEAIDCIKELFTENNTIKIIIQKLSFVLSANSCSNGKIKPTITPNSFMRTLGCSILLIKSLKTILRDSPEIIEGENKLEKLLQKIEGTSDEVEPSQLMQTPVASRSEFALSPVHRRNCKFFF